ncbi:MAG: DUF465 domain-containing protein [Myxococcota bacterium]
MESYERDRIEALASEDPQLHQLWTEHQEIERRLSALEAVRYRSTDEELERKRLQKTKLSGMDRIAAILAQRSGA